MAEMLLMASRLVASPVWSLVEELSVMESILLRDDWVLFGQRQEHPHTLLIVSVGLAVEGEQIMLFQLNPHQDVAGGCQREEEVPNGHAWRGPEGNEKAQHERVT